jgi:hypothetical protein
MPVNRSSMPDAGTQPGHRPRQLSLAGRAAAVAVVV